MGTRSPSTADVDLECWFCERPFEREAIERDAHLVPRRLREGGPFFRYRCPHCDRLGRVERNRAGAFLAAPEPVVPLAEPLFAFFDPEQTAELAKKRAHFEQKDGRREWFMGPYADRLLAKGWRPPPSRQAAHPRGPRAGGPTERPPGARPRPDAPPPRPEPAHRGSRRQQTRRAPSASPYVEPRPRTPHEVLGISPAASDAEIQKAYRDLVKQYHPDRFAQQPDLAEVAVERFKEIQRARDALLD